MSRESRHIAEYVDRPADVVYTRDAGLVAADLARLRRIMEEGPA